MKLLATILLSIALVGCATQSSGQSWQQQAFDQQGASIGEKVKSNAITITQGNRQMVSAAKLYFPNDNLLIGLWEDLSLVAEQMDKGEITAQRYEELRKFRFAIFNDANIQRHNQAMQWDAQQRRAQFLGNFMGSLGQSMQRSNQPGINCTTTAMPGVLTTNCR